MPGPYRRIDEPNVNQYVVTTSVKAKKKAAPAAVKPEPDVVVDEPKPVVAAVKKSTT